MKKNKKFFLRFAIQLVAIAIIVGLDQFFKLLATEKLCGAGLKTVIPSFIGLYYCENTGAAFSMFSSNTTALSVVTLILIAAALVYLALPKKRPVVYDICIPAIIAGGLGNLIDRFTKGCVVDYIMTLFVSFPVFNFADCFITCGCMAFLIYLIYEVVAEAKNKKDNAHTEVKTDD